MSRPPRRTLHNFTELVRRGQFLEILKVLRRRAINAGRFIIRVTLRSLGIYYDSPWIQRRMVRNLLERNYNWTSFAGQNRGLKVALIIRDANRYPKSSAFIRLLSPLTDPSLRGKLSLQLLDENSTDVSKDTDVVIVQRTAFDDRATAETLVKNLKASDCQLVVDTDDAFHSIDPDHPEHGEHQSRLKAFKYLTSQANQLWVSTPRLAEYFKGQTKALVTVVANSLDQRLWRSDSVALTTGPLRLLYMGTVSHDADWQLIAPALEELYAKHPDSFEVTVIGATRDRQPRPWLKRIYQKRNGSIYPRFAPWLFKQGSFDIGLSPLTTTDFNRNKSDIKCLDYLALGAVPLVSDLEPYQTPELQPFIIKLGNQSAEWFKHLENIIKDIEAFREKRSKLIGEAQSYLKKQRSSAEIGQRQLDLLKSLTS